MNINCPILEVAGTPRERGRQHGEQLRTLVRDRDRAWRHHLELTSRQPAERLIDDFLAATNFLSAISKYTPAILDEMQGIADGSGLSWTNVFAAQLMDEEWWFFKQQNGHHCTGLGQCVAHEAFAIVAQNMDLPGWMDGFQTIIVERGQQGSIQSVLLSAAGMIGLCGMNSRGVAICVNTLSQLPTSSTGLPVAFVVRALLLCTSAEAAKALLAEIPHASGQNYIIGDRERVFDLECSASGVTQVRPSSAPPNTVWHTNHPIADAQPDHNGASEHDHDLNSRRRFVQAESILSSRSQFDLDLVARVLGCKDDPDHPICTPRRGHHDFFSFASAIWQVGDVLAAAVSIDAGRTYVKLNF